MILRVRRNFFEITTFPYTEDHPANWAGSGALPMLCTPTICQVAVTRTLVDGGTGLSVLSVETFNLLCIPPGAVATQSVFLGRWGRVIQLLGTDPAPSN